MSSARFDRLPAYDIRACYGCGDDACVPTVAWIDNVTGRMVHCFPGDVPAEDGPVHDPRQSELSLDDASALLAWLDEPLLDDEFDGWPDDDNLSDVEADATTLRDAGFGTDEDYGLFSPDW
jgi:hypothetical protein